MIRLLTMVVLLSLSTFGWASAYPDKYEGVPNTFKDGDIIKAEDFNNNNLSIKKAINDIPAGATGPAGAVGATGPAGPAGPAGAAGVGAGLNCSNNQIIKWDDTNGIWVCVDDPFAGVNCNVGDQLRFGSSGWECRAEPITASLVQNSWSIPGDAPISTYFDSLNNVDTSTNCDIFNCEIRVTGVTDHTSCIVQVTGNAVSGSNVNITTEPAKIRVGDNNYWTPGQAVYISISCTP